jgi:hypothetical protein
VLEYLVPSKVRRQLLELLWRDHARGTASSLARQAGLAFGASYLELQAMAQAGLAQEALEGGRVLYEANTQSPYASTLRKLVASVAEAPKRPEPNAHWEAVRTELVTRGAVLWARQRKGAPKVPLEVLVAEACELAHHDASVAKVLPHFLLQKKDELSFERLEQALAERKEKHAAGLLLAIAAALSGDVVLADWAERLRDKRRTKVVDFFAGKSSARLRQLADRNTPDLARSWNYRLNLRLEDFRSVLEKFPLESHVPS